MTEKHDCSGKAYDVTGWRHCFRNATVEHDGKWWCWQHDPKRMAEEAVKRQAVWQAKMDREDAKYAHIAHNAKLGALVTLELAQALEQMAMLLHTSGWRGYAKDEIKIAEAVAAGIREALEVNDES